MNDSAPEQIAAARIPRRTAIALLVALVLATGLFIAGISLPMLTVTKLAIFSNTVSVISGITELYRNGQYPLFAVIAIFSIALPLLKLWILFLVLSRRVAHSGHTRRYLRLMHDLGRWAMLDVLVVAILVVTVKLGALASVEVHSGLYVFGASVLLIMLITHSTVHHALPAHREPDR